MAFDFKKEYKEFYMPKNTPEIVTYQHAVGILYAIAYTLKMSYKSDYKIEGFFEYVVPPLEGFWWQDGVDGCDYRSKVEFNWIKGHNGHPENERCDALAVSETELHKK